MKRQYKGSLTTSVPCEDGAEEYVTWQTHLRTHMTVILRRLASDANMGGRGHKDKRSLMDKLASWCTLDLTTSREASYDATPDFRTIARASGEEMDEVHLPLMMTLCMDQLCWPAPVKLSRRQNEDMAARRQRLDDTEPLDPRLDQKKARTKRKNLRSSLLNWNI